MYVIIYYVIVVIGRCYAKLYDVTAVVYIYPGLEMRVDHNLYCLAKLQ